MEPTIHCAIPGPGCEAVLGYVLLAVPVEANDLERGEIVIFQTPPEAESKCGAGGTFIKRVIGLPQERVEIRLQRGAAYVYIDGMPLDEPYIENDRRDIDPKKTFKVPLATTS